MLALKMVGSAFGLLMAFIYFTVLGLFGVPIAACALLLFVLLAIAAWRMSPG